MHRKSLLLIVVGLTLLTALFFQMSAVQATGRQQEAPVAAEPEPLPQPLRIQFRQQIPLTIVMPVALSAPEVVQLPAVEAITATQSLTEAAAALEAAALQAVAEAATTTTVATQPITEEPAVEPAGTGLTETATATSLPMLAILEISFDLVVSNTLTTTVPASVTLQLGDAQTVTLPVVLTVATLPDGSLFIEPQATPEPEPTATATAEPSPTPEAPTPTPEVAVAEPLTTTAAVTETVVAETTELTATAAVTETTPLTGTTPTTPATRPPAGGARIVKTQDGVTANLRTGPGVTFELAGEAAAGEALPLIAISEDGLWYLLADGTWIAGFLLAEQPVDLPIATQELIARLSGQAPAPAATITATVPVTEATTLTDTTTATATTTVTETIPPAATEVPAAATPVTTPPTVTVDANLRSGPGLEFPVIGGTITGQAITIVGRNADATWYRLDNTGWVAAQLVNNAPPPDSVPVVNADGTPVAPAEPAPTATPVPAEPTGGGLFFPTPTPLP